MFNQVKDSIEDSIKNMYPIGYNISKINWKDLNKYKRECDEVFCINLKALAEKNDLYYIHSGVYYVKPKKENDNITSSWF